MSASGYTPIYIYYSGTPSNVPLAVNLGNGELAINAADGNLFYKNTSNLVVSVPLLQSSSSQNGWLSSTNWTTFNNKQNALVSGTNIKTVNGNSLLGSGDLGTISTSYGGTGLTSFVANGIVYASSTSALATSSNFVYSASDNYLGLSFSSATAWAANTSTTNLQVNNSSATNNSTALYLAQTVYGDSSTGGVKFGAVASASYSADFVVANRNVGNFQENLRVTYTGNIYGTSGSTGMTNGFFYIPSAAGAPSGTPTSISGHVPMYYDTTNNQFYIYNGAWKKVALT